MFFSDELGTLKDFQADIQIDPQVTPKYLRAIPVPYSLKEKIEHELERLVKLGIYHPLASSKWAVKFTKLDLSQAYQQLLLSPRSRELLTINTHKGLFQPTRLQFGVNSASEIFQRELENRLAFIPYVKVRSDDILISGKNDVEHFNNLKKILKIIYDHGLPFKLQNCVFMQDEVVYLGFKMNKNGVFPVKEKIISIKIAEELKKST